MRPGLLLGPCLAALAAAGLGAAGLGAAEAGTYRCGHSFQDRPCDGPASSVSPRPPGNPPPARVVPSRADEQAFNDLPEIRERQAAAARLLEQHRDVVDDTAVNQAQARVSRCEHHVEQLREIDRVRARPGLDARLKQTLDANRQDLLRARLEDRCGEARADQARAGAAFSARGPAIERVLCALAASNVEHTRRALRRTDLSPGVRAAGEEQLKLMEAGQRPGSGC